MNEIKSEVDDCMRSRQLTTLGIDVKRELCKLLVTTLRQYFSYEANHRSYEE